MANVYYEKHGNPSLIQSKKVAVIGYGSQGHAHALNMRDSGVNVCVATYSGSASAARAKEDGLPVTTIEQATQSSDVIMILIPDETQKRVYKASIEPHLRAGQTLMFAHGFNIHFGQVVPPPFVDVSMIAPKSPGHRMRELFVEGVGVPALLAIHQDATGQAKQNALAYAWRSEEHTSELQSPCNLVCRLLLEKKKRSHDDRRVIRQTLQQPSSREKRTP